MVKLTWEQEELGGETIDISMNGMLVRTGSTFPVGTSVGVELDLSPGDKAFLGTGSVVRKVGETQMGIVFNLPTRSEADRLQEFLLPLMVQE